MEGPDLGEHIGITHIKLPPFCLPVSGLVQLIHQAQGRLKGSVSVARYSHSGTFLYEM